MTFDGGHMAAAADALSDTIHRQVSLQPAPGGERHYADVTASTGPRMVRPQPVAAPAVAVMQEDISIAAERAR